jgi:hypothetical protein
LGQRLQKNQKNVSKDGAEAIENAKKAPGQISSLILPADTAWGEGGDIVKAKDIGIPELKLIKKLYKIVAKFLN